MSTGNAPADIKITLRHVDPPEPAREYALTKLSDDIYSIPNVRYAAVEITFEATAAKEQRYVIDLNIEANGDAFRVEERGPDIETTTNMVQETLARQIRDWKGEVYFERRQEGAAYKEETLTEAASLPPDNKEGLIIRKESQEIKPMFVEDAAREMTNLGFTFLFFLNAESGEYNVVYERKDGGYGWIVPSYAGMETSTLPGPDQPETSG